MAIDYNIVSNKLHLRITTGNRGFILLKLLLVERVWDRMRNGLAPIGFAGASS
jgi:hypothetical protein